MIEKFPPVKISVSVAVLGAVFLAGGGRAQEEAQQQPESIVLGPSVVLETTQGPIKVALYQHDAPITTSNFLDLVRRHFYDGTPFHRKEEGFVVQGGSKSGPMGLVTFQKSGKPRRIPLEKPANLTFNKPGVLGMARLKEPNSASCQFFITLNTAPRLDEPPGYAAFGEVVSDINTIYKLQIGDKITRAYVEGESAAPGGKEQLEKP